MSQVSRMIDYFETLGEHLEDAIETLNTAGIESNLDYSLRIVLQDTQALLRALESFKADGK